MNKIAKRILVLFLILTISVPVYASNPYTESPRVLTPPLWDPNNPYTDDSDDNSTSGMLSEQ